MINGRIFFSAGSAANQDIYSVNPDGTGRRILTQTSLSEHSPAVSPDGRKIAFICPVGSPASVPEICVMNSDGSRVRNLTAFGAASEVRDPTWSPDGRQIVFSARLAGVDDVNNDFDLFVMSANGRNLRPLLGGPGESADDHQPSWSPDGARIAFTRNINAPGRILVINADGTGLEEFSTCIGGCASPEWAPDNSAIAYSAGSSLEVKSFGQPAQVLATNLRLAAGGPSWAPDGTKLVYPASAGETGTLALLVIVNRDGTGHGPLATGLTERSPSWARAR